MARHKQQPGMDARKAALAGLKAQDTSQDWRLEQIRWSPDGSHIINFGQIYVKRWCRSASPDFHREIAAFYYKHLTSIVTAPRGHAKTTLERIIAFYNAVTYGRDDIVPPEFQSEYDVFVAKIDKLAEACVNAVKINIEHNRLIREDFGDLKGNVVWEKGKIYTNTGHILESAGYGGTVRGLLGEDGQRPTGVMVDDLVDYRISRNVERMKEIYDWVLDDVIGLEGDAPARILITGNRMSRHDHLGLLKNDNKWPYQEYSAVLERDDNGKITKVLWPEMRSVEYLRDKERTMGSRKFKKVYENKPADDDEILFAWDSIQRVLLFGDPKAIKGRKFMYIDPAKSKNRKGDWAVILLGILDRDKILNVVAGMAIRTGSLTRIAKYAVDYYFEFDGIEKCGIETNGIGAGLPEILERMIKDREALRFRYVEIHHSTDKRLRIESVQPAVENQRVRIHHSLQFLIENMRDYPDVIHDDPCDGLAGLFEVVEQKAKAAFSGGVKIVGKDVMRSQGSPPLVPPGNRGGDNSQTGVSVLPESSRRVA